MRIFWIVSRSQREQNVQRLPGGSHEGSGLPVDDGKLSQVELGRVGASLSLAFTSLRETEGRRSQNVDIPLLFQAYESNPELKNFYKVLSTNSDGTLEFVSTIEGKSAATAPRRRADLP